MADATIRLVDINGVPQPTPDLVDNEVIFKPGYEWVWCLDARHEPYNAMEDQEILARAAKNRKRYVLLNAKGDA